MRSVQVLTCEEAKGGVSGVSVSTFTALQIRLYLNEIPTEFQFRETYVKWVPRMPFVSIRHRCPWQQMAFLRLNVNSRQITFALMVKLFLFNATRIVNIRSAAKFHEILYVYMSSITHTKSNIQSSVYSVNRTPMLLVTTHWFSKNIQFKRTIPFRLFVRSNR